MNFSEFDYDRGLTRPSLTDSSSDSLGSPHTSGSPPVTFTISSLGPNASRNPSSTTGSISSGTTTGTTSTVPFLPYMAGLSLLDFN